MPSDSAPIIAAVAGIIGALAGGASTGYWTSRTERLKQAYQREEQERAQLAEASQHRTSTRTAAAEVYFELGTNIEMLEAFLHVGRLPANMKLRNGAWEVHRSVLLADVPTAQWIVVARVYVVIEALGGADAAGPDHLDRALASGLRRSAEAAQRVLEPLTELGDVRQAPLEAD